MVRKAQDDYVKDIEHEGDVGIELIITRGGGGGGKLNQTTEGNL